MRSPVAAAFVASLVLLAACGSSSSSAPPATDLVGTAIVHPASVRAGDTVTITPSGEVSGYCHDEATVYRTDKTGLVVVGLLATDGTFTASSGGPPPSVQGCPGATTAPASYVIPAQLTPGVYAFCRSFGAFAPGCGVVIVNK